MQIIGYIGTGKSNAVARAALCKITNMPDRAVREAIEKARHEGHIIVNDQDGTGYYIADDIDEIERQFRQNQHRFKSIAHYQKFLRRRLVAAGRL